jgi:hypothetical protein
VGPVNKNMRNPTAGIMVNVGIFVNKATQKYT